VTAVKKMTDEELKQELKRVDRKLDEDREGNSDNDKLFRERYAIVNEIERRMRKQLKRLSTQQLLDVINHITEKKLFYRPLDQMMKRAIEQDVDRRDRASRRAVNASAAGQVRALFERLKRRKPKGSR
jgi:hypothetical protein